MRSPRVNVTGPTIKSNYGPNNIIEASACDVLPHIRVITAGVLFFKSLPTASALVLFCFCPPVLRPRGSSRPLLSLPATAIATATKTPPGRHRTIRNALPIDRQIALGVHGTPAERVGRKIPGDKTQPVHVHGRTVLRKTVLEGTCCATVSGPRPASDGTKAYYRVHGFSQKSNLFDFPLLHSWPT